MSRTVLFLLAAVSLGFAPAPFLPKKPRTVEADLKAIQGEWVEVSASHNGILTRGPGGGNRAVVTGDRLAFRCTDWERSRWRVTLDASKSPRVMAFVDEDDPSKVAFKIRYRLKGDTLTLCLSTIGFDLPDSLEPGKGVEVTVYKRKRP